jgi:hypothetical protein
MKTKMDPKNQLWKKKVWWDECFFGYKSLAGFHHKEVESEINSGWNCK